MERVTIMDEACQEGNIFVTATCYIDIILSWLKADEG